MDVDAKVTIIHVIGGLIAAFLSYGLTTGLFMGVNNEAFAIILSLIILYLFGQISERIFGKEAVGGIKGWLWSGIVPIFFIWIVVWIILLNVNPIPPINVR